MPRFFVERYFFFFDAHAFRLNHNCKIYTPRFEEGKRPSRHREPSEGATAWSGGKPCW
jgi:hypothetical protein